MMDAHAGSQVALVTGGNRGIGRAIAAGLAERGYLVLLTARDQSAAERAAADLASSGTLVPLQLDVTDQASVDRALGEVVERFGRLDALVNNAGAYYDDDQRTVSADLAIVEAALAVNLLGPWRLCLAALTLMRRQRSGRIVNVSSGAGAFDGAGGGTPAYSVSKAALNMLTVRLAAELRGSGILVNACCP